MTKKKIEITPKGLVKLQKELKERKTTTKKSLQDQLNEELKGGDISENTSYYRVLEEIESNQQRIDKLEELIQKAVVTNHADNPAKKGSVGIGSTVTLKKDGADIIYEIVGTTEADPAKNKISVESPIGSALANKKVNDNVTVSTPTGPIRYAIIHIS